MRFLLDEDVDAGVVGVLVGMGHQAWTVPQSGLQSVGDDTVAVYGHDLDAVVVSHDREFALWRKRNCVGRHLYLKCDEPDAGPLLEKVLDDVIAVLERYEDIFCEVGPNHVAFSMQWF